jgi:hypothetical protein
MKILILQDDLFEYLNHVVRSHAGGGISPEEGLAVYQLDLAIKGAKSIDNSQVAKINTGEANNTPVASIEVEQERAVGGEV